MIIPTEIRDYFGDKDMGIESMTVHVGLVHSSRQSIVLLSVGGMLMGASFLITFVQGQYPLLNLLLIGIAIVDGIALQKFKKLYALSKEYENSDDPRAIARAITAFSANNPKWILLVTQTYSVLSVILLVSKLI